MGPDSDSIDASVPRARFVGPPGALEAIVELAPHRRKDIRVHVSQPGQRDVPDVVPRVLTAPAGPNHTLVRIMLPQSTPPGVFEASVQLDDLTYQAHVEIQGETDIVVKPDRLNLEVRSGGQTDAEVQVLNVGNVAVTIEGLYAIGLFQVDGVEPAIHAGLSTKTAHGSSRLDRIMDELAARHGGLARLVVKEGAGPVEAGDCRLVRFTLKVSTKLQPGIAYQGTWALGPLEYLVRAYTAPAAKRSGTTSDDPAAPATDVPNPTTPDEVTQ